jgi:hypothetical protein
MRGLRRGKFCRRRHLLPGETGFLEIGNSSFYSLFHHGTGFALQSRAPAICGSRFKVFAMLLALGAVSTALDAIKSLSASKPASSQPVGFAPAGAQWSDGAATPAASGYSGAPQISADNFNTLLAAQSQSTGFSAGGVSASSPATTSFSTASSTYGAIDQLIQRQSTPAQLPSVPVSFSL